MKVFTLTKRVNVPVPFRINNVGVRVSTWPAVYLSRDEAMDVVDRDREKIASFVGNPIAAVGKWVKVSKRTWQARAGSAHYTITKASVRGVLK